MSFPVKQPLPRMDLNSGPCAVALYRGKKDTIQGKRMATAKVARHILFDVFSNDMAGSAARNLVVKTVANRKRGYS